MFKKFKKAFNKKLWRSKWNKDHVQKDFDIANGSNDNGGDNGAMREEVAESLERNLTHLQNNLRTKPTKTPQKLGKK
jgi:hypothetical protein